MRKYKSLFLKRRSTGEGVHCNYLAATREIPGSSVLAPGEGRGIWEILHLSRWKTRMSGIKLLQKQDKTGK